MRALSRSAVLLSLTLLLSSAALAQNIRSAVSVTGLDTNSCTVLNPCRTISAALARTNPLGEIVVLASGGYSPFTIDKSVSIISPGGIHAALSPTTGAGITVDGLINVNLRNLWINSLGGEKGILVLNAAQVVVENCTILGTVVGLSLESSSDGYLSVKDSFIRQNFHGIVLQPAGGSHQVTIDRARLEGNYNNGFRSALITGTTMIRSVVRDSVVTSGFRGITALNVGQGSIETNVENCVVASNSSVGLGADGTGVITRVSQTYITNNGVGVLSENDGEIRSFGNNRIEGNTVEGTFTDTIPLR